MKPLIDRIDPILIEQELNESKFARNTNKIGNEIFITTADDSPHTMQEIGRLRELSFRKAGGGTGKEVDIDKHDLGKNSFKQLIVWDPEMKIIVGGYRFAIGRDLPKDKKGQPISPTSHLFDISNDFMTKCLPLSIELGRSFVQPAYQLRSNARKSIFALDNLWDGLGFLIIDNPFVKSFFGKITMYTHYPVFARDAILYFLKKFFPDPDKYVRPYKPLKPQNSDEVFDKIFTGASLEENYKILNNTVRAKNTTIPPLVNAYMKLSPSMKSFGTAINENFGNVEETGILITINEIYESKKSRFISNIDRNFRRKNS